MGFVDVSELVEKQNRLEDENQELEATLARLEAEGQEISRTLRQVRERAEEMNQRLQTSEDLGIELRTECQAEQIARGEMQERLDTLEMELEGGDNSGRPLFVVFPTNRGTLGRLPPKRQPVPVKAPLRPNAITGPSSQGLLPAPLAGSNVAGYIQEPVYSSSVSHLLSSPSAVMRVVQDPLVHSSSYVGALAAQPVTRVIQEPVLSSSVTRYIGSPYVNSGVYQTRRPREPSHVITTPEAVTRVTHEPLEPSTYVMPRQRAMDGGRNYGYAGYGNDGYAHRYGYTAVAERVVYAEPQQTSYRRPVASPGPRMVA